MKSFPLFSAALLGLSLLGISSTGFAQGTTTGDTGSPGAVGSAPLPASQVPANGIVSKINPGEVSKQRRLVRDVASNTDNIRSSGNFGAQLWLTANGDFALDWKKPEAPTINPVEIALRDTPIYTVVIFYGEGRTTAGLGNVSYDITVLRPDGTVYNRRDALIGYQNLALPTSANSNSAAITSTLASVPMIPPGHTRSTRWCMTTFRGWTCRSNPRSWCSSSHHG